MLERLGVGVANEATPKHALPIVADPIAELGSRYLIKYVRADQAKHFSSLSGVTTFPGDHYLTPTPLTKAETASVLNLPPAAAPVRALLLLPEKLVNLRGPRRIAGGTTVEYLCDSFDLDAIASPQWGVVL